ncbi:Endopolyphosphatase [Scleroderma yunnanense]
MYFYSSNEGVQGCPKGDVGNPGNQQFEWLEDQLATFRSRQMQVWVMGHVPPKNDHYYSQCYVKYAELSLRFQDTILGHLYGHLNTDHFYFITGEDLRGVEPNNYGSSLYDTLVAEFATLPDPEEEIDYDDYAVINVNPSVVPNPYVPAFRAYAYNTTGLTGALVMDVGHRTNMLWGYEAPHRHGNSGNRHTRDLEITWRTNVPPSKRNSLWTPLGYAQYWMPKLEEYNGKHEPEYELEYLTFLLSRLHSGMEHQVAGRASDPQPLIPLENLPGVLQDSTVRKSKYAPYGMLDLTIGSWVELGWRIGQKREDQLRKRFRKYLYVGGKETY